MDKQSLMDKLQNFEMPNWYKKLPAALKVLLELICFPLSIVFMTLFSIVLDVTLIVFFPIYGMIKGIINAIKKRSF